MTNLEYGCCKTHCADQNVALRIRKKTESRARARVRISHFETRRSEAYRRLRRVTSCSSAACSEAPSKTECALAAAAAKVEADRTSGSDGGGAAAAEDMRRDVTERRESGVRGFLCAAGHRRQPSPPTDATALCRGRLPCFSFWSLSPHTRSSALGLHRHLAASLRSDFRCRV